MLLQPYSRNVVSMIKFPLFGNSLIVLKQELISFQNLKVMSARIKINQKINNIAVRLIEMLNYPLVKEFQIYFSIFCLGINTLLVYINRILKLKYNINILRQSISKQMSKVRHLKLPFSLANNATANRIRGFVERLGPESGYFSCVLYEKDNKKYFIKKDDQFPLIKFDWTIYTMMRTFARTIITSGSTLRKEHHTYNEDMGTYGKDEIKQMYSDNVFDPFNIIVYSNKMKQQDIKKLLYPKYFKYLSMNEVCANKGQGHSHSFKEIAEKVNEKNMGPTIYQNGERTLGQGLSNVKPTEKNFTELVVLSLYHGPMADKYIGNEYDMHILSRDFDRAWESEPIKSEVGQSDKNKEATVKFVVYTRKEGKHNTNSANHNAGHHSAHKKNHHK